MTEFRIGDIVKIERGEKDKPGYLHMFVRVDGRDDGAASLSGWTVDEYAEESRVTIIKQSPKYRTALVKYDGEIVPVIVHRDGMITLPTGDTVSRSGLGEERVIETCPYVPAGLIERAEEWYAGDHEWDADNILSAIVGSVRDHRDGLQ